jgi:acetyl esterase
MCPIGIRTSWALARGSGGLLVSVAYRLAPEHPFPVAVEDAYLTLEWVARTTNDLGGDARRLAVPCAGK